MFNQIEEKNRKWTVVIGTVVALAAVAAAVFTQLPP